MNTLNTSSTVARPSPFEWTQFYEAFADKLLDFNNSRANLLIRIKGIVDENPGLPIVSLQDQFADGTRGPLQDICPFTVFGIFNRQISNQNRKAIAKELADAIGLDAPVPNSFDGIPLVSNRSSWFFSYSKSREPNAIDTLWEVYACALRFDKWSEDPEVRSSFIEAYNRAARVKRVSWNLTMGLFWARPGRFPTLDSRSRGYLNSWDIQVANNVKESGEEFLGLLNTLREGFAKASVPVHSFQELSYQAWFGEPPGPLTRPEPLSQLAILLTA